MIHWLVLACVTASAFARLTPDYERTRNDLFTLIGIMSGSDDDTIEDEEAESDYPPDNCGFGDDNFGSEQGPIEVNECIENRKQQSCDYFEESACGYQDCLLGLEKDQWGCTISCLCASEGVFEGDIMVTNEDLPALETLYGITPSSPNSRAASRNKQRWDNIRDENGNYVIPYSFSEDIQGRPKTITAIYDAFGQYKKHTCLRFVSRTYETDYIYFHDVGKCFSRTGRKGGRQLISLGRPCASKGIVMHELMHAMGFWHEQSRPDRDKYIQILENNIMKGGEGNFRKLRPFLVDSMGSPYDTGSIMHYGSNYFSIGGRPTILRKNGQRIEAQREKFSDEDVKQLNMMYNCNV